MTTYPDNYRLHDADRPQDHAGDYVAPLSSTGRPFSHALRLETQQTTIYSTSADGILAELIDNYDPRELDGHDPAADTTLEQTRVDQRARHAYSVVVNHAAHAILTGASDDTITTLQRSTHYHQPLTHDELPEYLDQQIPLALIGAFYGPDTDNQPPSGNVVMLRTEHPEQYLHDLATIGAITLFKHSTITTPPVQVMIDLDPNPTHQVEPRLNSLEEALTALHANPTDTNAELVRERTTRLLAALDAAPLDGLDLDDARSRIAQTDGHQPLWRLTNRYLAQKVREVLSNEPASQGSEAVQ